MTTYRKTSEVARLINVSFWSLSAAIRRDRIKPRPQKDGSGDLIWSDEDIERAREAFKKTGRRRRKPTPAN